MKKIKYLFLLLVGILSTTIFSQENDEPLKCETPSRESYYVNNPKAFIEANRLEEFTKRFIQERKKEKKETHLIKHQGMLYLWFFMFLEPTLLVKK